MYRQMYNLNDYDIVVDYTIEDFVTWQEQKKDIIVPKIRMDKTILVSKKGNSDNKYTIKDYTQLFWLI